jgi:hypothetical protein
MKQTKPIRKISSLKSNHFNELQKIIKQKPNFSVQGSLGEFFDLYLVCEATARKIVSYNSGTSSKELHFASIMSAVNTYFPNKLTNSTITQIFNSNFGKRNNRTCRQLRNGYLHSLSEKDKIEIVSRIDSLKNDMNKWISIFPV